MTQFATIGKSEPRRDLPAKLTGEAQFTADVTLPRMLAGKVLRSSHARARVLSINVDAAKDLPGVRAVITPFDAPKGYIAPDVAILDAEVRFVGDEVAAVAADDADIAEHAISLIRVEYEPLPFVTDPREAIAAGAPSIHPDGNLVGGQPLTLTRGDVEKGFARADIIVEDTFTTAAHSPAALEPRAVSAAWDDDRLTIWKASRGTHVDQRTLSTALNIPRDSVRVVGLNMGAGFGSKDESRLSAITAVLAQRSGRPVKIELTRSEEFVAGRHRHSTITTIRMGVISDGEVTAVHATTIMDTGAYLSSGPGVIRRAGQGALYLYRCADVRYDGYLTYTNTPAAGSYRALGAPQGHFALEMLADKAAAAVGMDPLAFRLKNHVGLEGQPGRRMTPADQIMDSQPVEGGVPFSSNGLRECLERGAAAFGWGDRSDSEQPGRAKRGVGMSMFVYRGGPGGQSSVRMKLASDGAIHLISGLMDVGEGAITVISQIAAEELGVGMKQIQTTFGDTEQTPEAPITAGSTATFSSGTAARDAAGQLRELILNEAASLLDVGPNELAIDGDGVVVSSDPERRMTLSRIADAVGEIEVEASVTPGSAEYIVNSFGAHFAEVEVDTVTGQVRVIRYVAAQDSGRILNPSMAVNQVEGAVSQMLGFTLSEEMVTDSRNGVTLNDTFLTHKSPTVMDYPDFEVVFADVVDPVGPYGAKGLGEPPSVGVAPAVANAIFDATGLQVRDLPITPDRILGLLDASERGEGQ
ncbi:MAG: molybdopterin-dependent oxidoreductase [SAR202 cluster bacterium]|jgi:xanthine dehydrogenase molybdenum-binding subunit|nr:molybdopterin-dependent oxidoreductase [SAR202 cluster bacterium]MDP7225859.1 molybdopterin-dependent oxidoreductase [SAR202 cluster bacterium]MDP7415107.1 molybdopterin-dependent oxidoreductase [SAR202 cluster bacterium]HJO81162.1 molybdopterin cofactor-binding domain-containing protein [SAR202 cluster bacterium]